MSSRSSLHDSAPLAPEMAAEICLELDRILASDPFSRAIRISDFLRYVVEETLAGRKDRIKAFNVAEAVFNRDASFDQQRDPIVRVEANRLRKCLAQYYDSLDEEPLVRIDIPKGGYVPVFRRHESTTHDPNKRLTTPPTTAIVSAALLLALVLVIWWAWTATRSQTTVNLSSAENPSSFLAVLPLSNISGDVVGQRLAESFVDSTITMLAKLPGLSVMAHSSMVEFGKTPVSIRRLRDEYGISHVLRGSLERTDELLRIHTQLIETEALETVWSDTLEGRIEDVWTIQDELAKHVSEALSIHLEPSEKDYFYSRHTDSIEALTLYRQGLILIIPPNEPKRVWAGRQLFKRVSEIDPNFAGGYAGESYSHSLTVLFQATTVPEEELKKAVALARKSIQVDPTFGAGYALLGYAQALSGNKAKAVENVQLAAAIQPKDAFIRFIQGMTLILAGLPEQSFDALDEALRLSPVGPRIHYLNVQSIGRFILQEYQRTIEDIERNYEKGGPKGPHMEVFRATSYAQLGNEKKAIEIIAEMKRSFPDYPYANWLEMWIGNGEYLEESLQMLTRLELLVP